ncbi:unnamed protein product [Linum trigynum]|uniref:Uncharacterized protein n=1 Tax=Linum trigynum TaxID=586398 RepID=A0AAV2E7J6_9ROSI
MRHPVEPLHLGLLVATTFAQFLGWNKVDTMHMGGGGGIITRLAQYFDVDVKRASIVGRTEAFPSETLYNMKLVLQGEPGVEYLDGL